MHTAQTQHRSSDLVDCAAELDELALRPGGDALAAADALQRRRTYPQPLRRLPQAEPEVRLQYVTTAIHSSHTAHNSLHTAHKASAEALNGGCFLATAAWEAEKEVASVLYTASRPICRPKPGQ